MTEKVFFRPKEINFQRQPEGVDISFKAESKDLLRLWELLLMEEEMIFSLFIPQHRIIDIDTQVIK